MILSNDVNLLRTHYLVSADALISGNNKEEKTTHLLGVMSKSLDTIKTQFSIECKTKGENYEKMRVFSKLTISTEHALKPFPFAGLGCSTSCTTLCCSCSCCC